LGHAIAKTPETNDGKRSFHGRSEKGVNEK
jgi:hypothetical protein